MHHKDAQRGFTVVELMIVVAIIAVLAAVVIPSFIKEGRRASYKSEVNPTFAELGTRQEQYKIEVGAYMAAPAFPASANSDGTDVTTPSTEWTTLRVQPPEGKLKCSYVIAKGDAGVAPSADASWPAWLTSDTTVNITPATSWYFIKATCPANQYFTASWDVRIRSQDGH